MTQFEDLMWTILIVIVGFGIGYLVGLKLKYA